MGGDSGLLGGVSKVLFGDPTAGLKKSAERSSGYISQSMQMQKEMFDKSLAAYQEQMNKALAAQQAGQQQGIAGQLAGAQVGADLLRWATAQQQAQQLPMQAARLSALQALPQLQQFIGTQAYALPTSFETTPMPEVNYLNAYQTANAALDPMFQNTMAQINAAAGTTGATTTPGTAGTTATATTPGTPAGTSGGTGQLATSIGKNMYGKAANVPFETYLAQARANAAAMGNPGAIGSDADIRFNWEQNRPLMILGNVPTPATPGTTTTTTAPGTVGTTLDTTATGAAGASPAATAGAGGAGGAGTAAISAVTPAEKTMYELSPYAGPAYNYQESPIYKLQQEQITRNIDRALAARGLRGGAAGAAVQGQAARELAAAEAEKAYGRLMDQVQIGLGYQPTSAGATGATQLANVYGNLGSQMGATQQAGAAQRAGLYSQYGSGLASAYTGFGAGQAQGLLAQSQNQMALGNALAQTPSAGAQLVNLGLTAYGMGAFGGGGTGMQMPVNYGMAKSYFSPMGLGLL